MTRISKLWVDDFFVASKLSLQIPLVGNATAMEFEDIAQCCCWMFKGKSYIPAGLDAKIVYAKL